MSTSMLFLILASALCLGHGARLKHTGGTVSGDVSDASASADSMQEANTKGFYGSRRRDPTEDTTPAPSTGWYGSRRRDPTPEPATSQPTPSPTKSPAPICYGDYVPGTDETSSCSYQNYNGAVTCSPRGCRSTCPGYMAGSRPEVPCSSPASSPTPAPTPTPTPPPSSAPADCTVAGSVPADCSNCLESSQCATGFCCPFLKKCVASGSQGCSYPIANCRPVCHSADVASCKCNPSRGYEWAKPTCGSGGGGGGGGGGPVPTPAPPVSPEGGGGDGSTVSDLEWDHFQRLNQLRAAGFTCPQGSAYGPNNNPLKFDCRLWRASQLHSEDMAAQGYFAHQSADGRSPWDRAKAQNVVSNGENIAAGRGGAQAVLDQWKNSDGHCRNMGNSGFTVAAVGYGFLSSSPFRHYWTQMFSSRVADADVDESCHPLLTQTLSRSSEHREVATSMDADADHQVQEAPDDDDTMMTEIEDVDALQDAPEPVPESEHAGDVKVPNLDDTKTIASSAK